MDKISRLIFLCLLPIVFVSACAGEESTPENLPSIEPITLQTTPSLEHWLIDVAACAGEIPNFAVITHIEPLENLNLEQADLILRIGERRESDPFVAVMGFERTMILAGSEVPLNALSHESLQMIFSGEITNWREVPEFKEAGREVNQPIQTLSYPEGHELRLLFQQAFLEGEAIASEPLIFSTETYLEALLETHPYAIGYTLESRLPPGIGTLPVSKFDETLAQHTVLAITPEEPTGSIRQLLLCLQN